MTPANGRFKIVITLIMALLLTILPAPDVLENFRPHWLLLVLAYWCMALPYRVSVGYAWGAGLVLDLLLGAPLGIRSLALSIVIYIISMNHRVIRNLSLWQQALMIGLLVLLDKLVVFWAERMLFDVSVTPMYLWSILTTMLIWPWIFLILRKIRRQFAIK
ncbi:MAG: rod shape-determining protein MreD [Moritella sp.]|jgi:rod shape-determining protein MreD